MKIILCDINKEITDAWNKEFAGLDNVQVINDDFRALPNKVVESRLCLCAAGNSFGVMGGGLDLVIANTFPGVEGKIRNGIKQYNAGELLVGDVLIAYLKDLEHNFSKYVWLYYVPTMRAPMNIQKTTNIYNATRAALRTHEYAFALDHAIVIPGFGGSCGQVDPLYIARSMRLAYDNHVNRTMPETFNSMLEYEHKVRKASYL